jgi:hypothetical protein
MTILCASLLFVAAVVYLIAVRLVCEERGYQRGHKAGYEAGRADEALWWWELEKQVDQPQSKVRPQ